ncbi:hypothetical protein Psta_3000 [Pirellula staleyi DSM 6068]|uniref:Uncharacterized protein n=1 Tax=Pirellula staleyi (strain ATCC 27377 / DSM 6068 / ICPB 4128) TaxID=530564 RepID=D2R9B5_PIRSD|nr:hypothetical protein Psta_3000 [Pirellula staleyi DSM 6068]
MALLSLLPCYFLAEFFQGCLAFDCQKAYTKVSRRNERLCVSFALAFLVLERFER